MSRHGVARAGSARAGRGAVSIAATSERAALAACPAVARGPSTPGPAPIATMPAPIPEPTQRLAVLADAPAIGELMRSSVRALFPRFYDARQTASAVVHVASLDIALIEDGTYYVHEAGGEIVACGGWSRRNRLHAGRGAAADDDRLLDPRTEPARVRAMFVRSDWTRRGLGRAIIDACADAARAEGFTTLALMATLPGEPLYRACGFRETGRTMVVTPDGVALEGVTMQRAID